MANPPIRKMPPPPSVINTPEINRWLHDLQNFILPAGGIDSSQVAGFSALQSTVAVNSANIATLSSSVSSLSSTVSSHTSQISSLNSTVATHTSQITTLQSQVGGLTGNGVIRNGTTAPASGLGNVGDWYADTTSLHIYVKTASAVWTLIV